MFLFIFESIGTSELILIGIVALIFLGPRRLPEIAKKMGKIMADFRNTTNEFKQTWEREVNFEEEAKALREIADDTAPRVTPPGDAYTEGISAPEIKQIDASNFEAIPLSEDKPETEAEQKADDPQPDTFLSDKKSWL